MTTLPFQAQSPAISIAVTTTASTSTALPASGPQLRVVNIGPNECYISVGTGTRVAVVATGSSNLNATPVIPGDVTFSIASDSVQNISAICDAGKSCTLIVQVGDGI